MILKSFQRVFSFAIVGTLKARNSNKSFFPSSVVIGLSLLAFTILFFVANVLLLQFLSYMYHLNAIYGFSILKSICYSNILYCYTVWICYTVRTIILVRRVFCYLDFNFVKGLLLSLLIVLLKMCQGNTFTRYWNREIYISALIPFHKIIYLNF